MSFLSPSICMRSIIFAKAVASFSFSPPAFSISTTSSAESLSDSPETMRSIAFRTNSLAACAHSCSYLSLSFSMTESMAFFTKDFTLTALSTRSK